MYIIHSFDIPHSFFLPNFSTAKIIRFLPLKMLEARIRFIRNISLLSSVKRAYCSVNKISFEGPNSSFLPIIYNKNPRNLERLRIAPKPSGYVLDKKPVNFWHRYSLYSRLKNYYLLAIGSKRHMMTIHCAKLKRPILNSPCG